MPPRARRRPAGGLPRPLYYPLAYWSLLGMETGLLALLLLAAVAALLIYRRSGDLRWARGMAVLLGLCYLSARVMRWPGWRCWPSRDGPHGAHR